jgi:hypothetical protein
MTTAKARGGSRHDRSRLVVVAAGAALLASGVGATRAGAEGACTRTARLQFAACRHEVHDDRLVEQAKCVNVADEDERAECMAGLPELRMEGNELCREQRDARQDVCELLGEEPYDPSFDPADFTTDFVAPVVVNPYLPLEVGNLWEYAAPDADETNSVEVLDKTKLIEGVTCVVVRDLVSVGGIAKEFTDDWLAQATNGDVVYCGEEAKDFEVFPGDVPPDPELVSIDGSFKAGRDGDAPGILFLSQPTVGAVYRQEFSLGNAEDIATVLATDYDFGDDPTLDQFVPQDLADHLCNDDCVVTAESTPIEPGSAERKYYANGLGLFLEVAADSGEINRLVACNVDPRCATLPPP